LTCPVGGKIDEVKVSLRFFDQNLDPAIVTEPLQCEPTKSRRKGDVIPHKKYHIVAKDGAWTLSRNRTSEHKLEEEIQAIFDQLPDNPEVWEELAQCSRGGLFCGLFFQTWNRGLGLSPEITKQIAARHLSLELDIYFDDEDDD
jgi:hypothetical protein